ncbi:MAG: transporter [Sphingomonas sp. SCN 67-18]|uniref:TolC family protein n=1 Tax=uncultured Sphingomonas sp. TaxID=158754 RepID=UPI00086B68DB|nr:TolC family protein [Sphingomonas sp. SCN 67-18]ODU22922.1 MAG: transporter [Sphingomonas sp. SCN 67-18]
MHRLIAALLAAAACAGIAQAQTPPSTTANAPLRLDDALALAGVASPALEAARADVRAAGAARVTAGLRPNPQLTLDAENIAGSGPYRALDGLETTAALALPVELGGKRSARLDLADAQGRRMAIQAAIAEADLKLAVIAAYAEAAAAEHRLGAAQAQARIAADALRAAQVRVQAGRASPIEVQRAEVSRANADAAAEQTERLVTLSRFNLSKLIGRPLAEGLDGAWFRRVRPGQGPLRPADSAGTLALAAAEADVAMADAGVRLARSQRVPDLTLSAGARHFRETGDTAALLGLSIPIPLFNGGRSALAQAASERQGAEARRRMAGIDADRAIARAEADLANAATSAATASGPALAAAEETARIARIGYREGKFGQLELLDAERTLADTQIAAIDALLSFHIATAQLERLTARAPAISGENP